MDKEKALEIIKKRYGGIAAYTSSLGLSSQTVNRIMKWLDGNEDSIKRDTLDKFLNGLGYETKTIIIKKKKK